MSIFREDVAPADPTHIKSAAALVTHISTADNALAEACRDLDLDLAAAHASGQEDRVNLMQTTLEAVLQIRTHTRGQLTAAMISLCTCLSVACSAEQTVEEMLQQTGERRAPQFVIDALRIVAATFASPAGVSVD